MIFTTHFIPNADWNFELSRNLCGRFASLDPSSISYESSGIELGVLQYGDPLSLEIDPSRWLEYVKSLFVDHIPMFRFAANSLLPDNYLEHWGDHGDSLEDWTKNALNAFSNGQYDAGAEELTRHCLWLVYFDNIISAKMLDSSYLTKLAGEYEWEPSRFHDGGVMLENRDDLQRELFFTHFEKVDSR